MFLNKCDKHVYCLLLDDGPHASQTLVRGQGEDKISQTLVFSIISNIDIYI
jgi:hypothetical protein